MGDGSGAPSLQERYAPGSICFGCGPANVAGLGLRSLPGPDGSEATWQPRREHEAFPGVLNGGVISTLLDCHSNWTAAVHLMSRRGSLRPPVTVTAELLVRLRRPTPSDRPVRLHARVVDAESDDGRVVVEARLRAQGRETAVSRGTFVAVGPRHPAYEAWSAASPTADIRSPDAMPPDAKSATARETSPGR